MTLKYWLKNIHLGALLFGITLYTLNDKPKTIVVQLLIILAFFSGLLFPFAKNAIERVALRYTTRESWTTGLFMETSGKSGIYAMYYMVIFTMAIPIGVMYCIFLAVSRKAT